MTRANPQSHESLAFNDMIFIVTGGGSGIGLRTVQCLLAQGASVIAVDMNTDAVTCLKGNVKAVCGDAKLPDVADEALSLALAGGRLDGVVFAAGASSAGSMTEVGLGKFNQDLARNLTMHLPLSQAVLRHRTATQFSTQCSLVYVASKQAVAPSSGFGGYPVAKGAMLQMARLFALGGARYGVRANTVNPDAVFDGSKFWETGTGRGEGAVPRRERRGTFRLLRQPHSFRAARFPDGRHEHHIVFCPLSTGPPRARSSVSTAASLSVSRDR